MKLSLNWLSDYIDLSDISSETLSNQLSLKAFEVEDILESGYSVHEGIILGEILSIEPHPNADKLQITQTAVGVDSNGEKIINQIVCGAKNIAVGQKVPVAMVGTSLTNIKGDVITIKESTIRGINSLGMLCAVSEMGLSEAYCKNIENKQGNGIYILQDKESNIDNIGNNHEIGTAISKIITNKKDTIFDIGARSNRGDALCVLGQAREFAAVFAKQVKELNIIPLEIYKNSTNITTPQPIIENTADCSIFYSLAVEGIKVGASPEWLSERLESMGMRSINNVVDISNYVQLELGQPLHFYDLDKLNGNEIICRRAKQNEECKTLEEKEYTLNNKVMVISDSKQVSAIAGVMGSYSTQVTESTTRILIEAARFTPATVRRSSRIVGIESEAKRRFERGISPQFAYIALHRAVELLNANAATAKFAIARLLKAGNDELSEKIIELKQEEIKRILGINITIQEAAELLAKLNIKNIDTNKFQIPHYRQNDLHREIDLIEEIARLYGYDNIPSQAPRLFSKQKFKNTANNTEIINQLKSKFIAKGFNQVILSSLVTAEDIHNSSMITMDNPLSQDYSALRISMLPSLIKITKKNYSRDDSKDIKLFEFGKNYRNENTDTETELNKIQEIPSVAAIVCKLENEWNKISHSYKEAEFYKMKSLIEDLYPGAIFQNTDTKSIPEFMHPYISASIKYAGKAAGFISKIHPIFAEKHKISPHTYFFELNLPHPSKNKFKEIIKANPIVRDITVDADPKISYQEIISTIQKIKLKDLISIKLLDLYENSFTLRFKWLSEKDYSREEIDNVIANLKVKLQEKIAVKFRA